MSQSSERFYNRFSFLYPVIDLFTMPQKKKFVRMVNVYPSGKVLEVGVGNGSHLKYYAAHSIVGIDTSSRMLLKARKNSQKNITLIQMNGEKLLFPDESFDYVVLSHVIAVADSPENIMKEAYRVLKPAGSVFILNHFTPDNPLKYLDLSIKHVSRFLHFKSVFYQKNLKTPERFTLKTSVNAGLLSYFKILVYEKSL